MTPRTRRPVALSGHTDGFATTEVRWFASGPLPASILGWFTAQPCLVEVRSDRYRLDGSTDIGLKSRNGGRLEAKLRRPSDGSVALADAPAGRIEEWVKIQGVNVEDLPSAGPARWADVGKLVLTRSYASRGGTSVYVTHRRTLDAPGCDIEIADVTVGDVAAWTFALEAWGPAEQRRAILRSALDHFCATSPLPDELLLMLDRDASYPEWLNGLEADRVSV